MSCSYGPYDQVEFDAAKAVAVSEQPRHAANQPNRRMLPHAHPWRQGQSFLLEQLPLTCRLSILKHVLQRPHTRLERWRPFYDGRSVIDNGAEALDADCFPYAMTTAGTEKLEKPLALLLCCRQLYSEGLKMLYSSTTFVFSAPIDLHCFRLVASPEGLTSVRGLIIAFGRVDWPSNAPLCSENNQHTQETLKDWEGAFHDLQKIPSLQELQVWLCHRSTEELDSARRPWEKGTGNEAVERRHQKLFDVFGTAHVPDFTVNLTWNPKDLLSQREWPFKASLQTIDDISRGISELPDLTEPDLYKL